VFNTKWQLKPLTTPTKNAVIRLRHLQKVIGKFKTCLIRK
jgi:hypothetical protein